MMWIHFIVKYFNFNFLKTTKLSVFSINCSYLKISKACFFTPDFARLFYVQLLPSIYKEQEKKRGWELQDRLFLDKTWCLLTEKWIRTVRAVVGMGSLRG